MTNWIKSADGMMKSAKNAISQLMPGRKMTVNNAADPTSAYSMAMRKNASMKPPSQAQAKGFRKQ